MVRPALARPALGGGTAGAGGRTFIRAYAYPTGCVPEGKQQMVEMTLNGSGVRDSARVVPVGPTTGRKELKKSCRTLAGEHRGESGLLARGDRPRRSAPRRGDGGRREVELREEQSSAAVVVARDRPSHRGGAGLGLGESGRYGLWAVAAITPVLGLGAFLYRCRRGL